MPSMQAILLDGPGDVRLVETPIPTPGPGELLVKGWRGADLRHRSEVVPPGTPTYLQDLTQPFWPRVRRRRRRGWRGRRAFRLGQRVVAANSAPCGDCAFCPEERVSLCERLEFLNGAYAEISSSQSASFGAIPTSSPTLWLRRGRADRPLACVLPGCRAPPPAWRAAIGSARPIGLLFVNALTLRGLGVVASDRHESRLSAARHFGAVATVNAAEWVLDEQVVAVRALTPGERGAPVVIEAVGRAETWAAATRMARRGGQILLFGGAKAGTTFPVDATALHYDELTIKGVFHHTPRHIHLALYLIASGAINARDYLTANRPLAETIAALEDDGRATWHQDRHPAAWRGACSTGRAGR